MVLVLLVNFLVGFGFVWLIYFFIKYVIIGFFGAGTSKNEFREL